MCYRLTFVAGLAVGFVLGTRAGRERYEQLRKAADRFARNPTVRNTAGSAAHQGRHYADKAYHAVSDRVGARMPDSVAERMRSPRESDGNGRPRDDWGTGES
ncbi:YtxH domain-containing protein [Streptomyces sp. ZYX-F-203]